MSTIKFSYIVRNVMKDDGGYSHIFVQTPSTRIAFRSNRFGAAASTHGILSGNEQGLRVEEAQKGAGAARAGKLISLYRECSQHEPYADWLTSFHELKVSASRCGLRYRADYYGGARSNERARENGRARIQRKGETAGGLASGTRGQRPERGNLNVHHRCINIP
jgi:hypothetical protein